MYSLRNIQFPLPPHFSPFPFLSKRAAERERTNRRQISFYSFSIYLSKQNIRKILTLVS